MAEAVSYALEKTLESLGVPTTSTLRLGVMAFGI